MEHVRQMVVESRMTVGQLVDEMAGCGVLGAGRLARGVDLMVEMFEKSDYTTFLSLAGPMVPGGLRNIISDLIGLGYVDAVVTSGGNIVHDIIEALGYRGVKGSSTVDDSVLRDRDIGTAGDVYFEHKGFEAFEKKVYEIFDSLTPKNEEVAVYELLSAIGHTLGDERSFLKKAAIRNVPIFSPGILDSMLGFHTWTYGQLKSLRVNPVLDMNKISDIVYSSKRIGARRRFMPFAFCRSSVTARYGCIPPGRPGPR